MPSPAGRTATARLGWSLTHSGSEAIMKSIILWLCGVPLVAIIALKIFGIL